jgi:cytochrome b
VWDAPVRVFHWLLAQSFAGAYVTLGLVAVRVADGGCGAGLLVPAMAKPSHVWF